MVSNIALFLCIFLCIYYISTQVSGVIISPCRVRNMVTQPTHGTSLKTRNLVNIIQIPPVFTQNVIIGRCDNRDEKVSTGRAGELYVCQQRYSAVEVYVADSSSPSADPSQPGPTDVFQDLKFVRDSVIVESGCDFTFNLFPFLSQNPSDQQPNQAQPQQKMFLRSPYHPTGPGNPSSLRQPVAPPTPISTNYANAPYSDPASTSPGAGQPNIPVLTNNYPPYSPSSTLGRASEDDALDDLEDVLEEN